MRAPIIVPPIGQCDEPVRVNGWFVDEGDWVVAGDLVVELLISGVTFDIASESAGQLVEISKNLDSIIKSGEILGWLDSPIVESSDGNF